MTDSGSFTNEDVLHVFEQLDDPTESLSTSEVAEAMGCARRTAYARLNALTDSGRLQTKKVGGQVRIWWYPYGDEKHILRRRPIRPGSMTVVIYYLTSLIDFDQNSSQSCCCSNV